MEIMKIEELSLLLGMTEKNIIKRYCQGLPMPPSIKIPRSKVRLWKVEAVYAWLEEQAIVQQEKEKTVVEMSAYIKEARQVRRKRGRPRKAVNMEHLEKLVANY